MLTANEAASIFEFTGHRLKQILKEENLPCERKGGRGQIYLPPSTVRSLIHSRKNQTYKTTTCTIGIEKGGTGKTSISLQTAIAGARKGCKVAVIDLDPEACATSFLMPDDFSFESARTILEVYRHNLTMFECMAPSRFTGIDFLPSRAKARRVEKDIQGKNPKNLLKNKMKEMFDYYDLILFDVPPSFTTLTSSAYLSSDIVICPVTSDVFAIESLALTVEDIKDAAEQFETDLPEIKVLRNRFATQRRNSRETNNELIREHRDLLLPFYIKNSASIENAINDGVSIYQTKGNPDLKGIFTELFDYICPLEDLNETL